MAKMACFPQGAPNGHWHHQWPCLSCCCWWCCVIVTWVLCQISKVTMAVIVTILSAKEISGEGILSITQWVGARHWSKVFY